MANGAETEGIFCSRKKSRTLNKLGLNNVNVYPYFKFLIRLYVPIIHSALSARPRPFPDCALLIKHSIYFLNEARFERNNFSYKYEVAEWSNGERERRRNKKWTTLIARAGLKIVSHFHKLK